MQINPLGRLNVFYGANGSGKTSVLESVHVLGLARSFRAGSTRNLVTHGEERLTVFAELASGGGVGRTPVGVERAVQGEASIRIAGEDVRSIASLAEHLPVQVINAQSFELLGGAPATRRQFLDWGVFHVEQSFLATWRRFQRAIKQRNNILRHDKIDSGQLAAWTQELAQSGERIAESRQAYAQRLIPEFESVLNTLAPELDSLTLRLRRGWEERTSYAEALQQSEPTDRERGYTHTGPQRADIRLSVAGHPAAETLSRGQQKLVVCALKLAQGRVLTREKRQHCVYLVDDLASELDKQHAERVCRVLEELQAQVFITCVDKSEILDVWPDSAPDLSVFHVKHGLIERDETVKSGSGDHH